MIHLDEHGTWATIPEAATIRGVTERAIEQLIARNPHTIRTTHDGQRTWIRTDDIHKPRPRRGNR